MRFSVAPAAGQSAPLDRLGGIGPIGGSVGGGPLEPWRGCVRHTALPSSPTVPGRLSGGRSTRWQPIVALTFSSGSLPMYLGAAGTADRYCGHGDSSQYLAASRVERLRKCAAVLLMGCSSGRLRDQGQLDPDGHAIACLCAGRYGCPGGACWSCRWPTARARPPARRTDVGARGTGWTDDGRRPQSCCGGQSVGRHRLGPGPPHGCDPHRQRAGSAVCVPGVGSAVPGSATSASACNALRSSRCGASCVQAAVRGGFCNGCVRPAPPSGASVTSCAGRRQHLGIVQRFVLSFFSCAAGGKYD